ncbi:TspO/MBR family protein [Candidatus Margulisiibacteriota bacterium]
MSTIKAIKLIFAVFICHLAGMIGSLATYQAIPTWYAFLNKPVFNPPNWIFAPVWLTLYTVMGIAAFIIWEKGLENEGVRKALTIFGIQLILNSIWSIIFFGLHLPLFAFIEIVIMWIFILLTIIYFYRISKTAGLILIPYILWVSFASVLNLSIALLN